VRAGLATGLWIWIGRDRSATSARPQASPSLWSRLRGRRLSPMI